MFTAVRQIRIWTGADQDRTQLGLGIRIQKIGGINGQQNPELGFGFSGPGSATAVSAADPDPGSGAFLTSGSGILDEKKIGSGIRDKHPGSATLTAVQKSEET
jgi:hypothetical protein